ncbi:MAG: hypothetical protein JW850_23450, partial [Thermoflexales bacterium]|nr:hypothetical protein [Thermoflexales bacterium]
AKAHIEEIGRGKANIIVTELPYQVNKSNLIERIAGLVRDGKLEGITDVRDESDRSGMRLIIETTRTVEPKEILAQLYKYTPLRSTFGIILLALVDGEPRTLSLKKILQLYVEHRQEIVTRRTRYDLARAQERAHILEGLLKALASIDEVIQIIRRSPDADTARQRLMKRFKLSEIQANAILDMPLRRLARLERDKLEAEYKELKARIKSWQDLLKHPAKILALIKDELLAIKAKYADGRRTHIAEHAKGELMTTHELTPEASVWIGLGLDGQLSRLGERLRMPGEGAVAALVQANTRDTLYVFNDRGRVGQTPVHQVPDGGVNAADLTGLARDDRFVAALALPHDEDMAGFVLFGTRGGVVKRVTLSDFVRATGSAFGAINVDEGDSLEWVRLSQGDGEIVLVTLGGQAIRFTEESVRPMGLNAGGVLGIKLSGKDAVIGMDLARPRADLLIVTENGYGKRTSLSEYPVQGRYGNGVITARPSSSSGMLVGAAVVNAGTHLAVATDKGQSKLFKAGLAPSRKRDARMDEYLSLRRGDSVAALVLPSQAEPGETSPSTGAEAPAQAELPGLARQPAARTPAASRKTGKAPKANKTSRASTTRKTRKPAGAAKPPATRKASKKTAKTRKNVKRET